ncbi:MAG: hypothetical protein WEA61_11075 [Anaerolineales bacterium]
MSKPIIFGFFTIPNIAGKDPSRVSSLNTPDQWKVKIKELFNASALSEVVLFEYDDWNSTQIQSAAVDQATVDLLCASIERALINYGVQASTAHQISRHFDVVPIPPTGRAVLVVNAKGNPIELTSPHSLDSAIVGYDTDKSPKVVLPKETSLSKSITKSPGTTAWAGIFSIVAGILSFSLNTETWVSAGLILIGIGQIATSRKPRIKQQDASQNSNGRYIQLFLFGLIGILAIYTAFELGGNNSQTLILWLVGAISFGAAFYTFRRTR